MSNRNKTTVMPRGKSSTKTEFPPVDADKFMQWIIDSSQLPDYGDRKEDLSFTDEVLFGEILEYPITKKRGDDDMIFYSDGLLFWRPRDIVHTYFPEDHVLQKGIKLIIDDFCYVTPMYTTNDQGIIKKNKIQTLGMIRSSLVDEYRDHNDFRNVIKGLFLKNNKDDVHVVNLEDYDVNELNEFNNNAPIEDDDMEYSDDFDDEEEATSLENHNVNTVIVAQNSTVDIINVSSNIIDVSSDKDDKIIPLVDPEDLDSPPESKPLVEATLALSLDKSVTSGEEDLSDALLTKPVLSKSKKTATSKKVSSPSTVTLNEEDLTDDDTPSPKTVPPKPKKAITSKKVTPVNVSKFSLNDVNEPIVPKNTLVTDELPVVTDELPVVTDELLVVTDELSNNELLVVTDELSDDELPVVIKKTTVKKSSNKKTVVKKSAPVITDESSDDELLVVPKKTTVKKASTVELFEKTTTKKSTPAKKTVPIVANELSEDEPVVKKTIAKKSTPVIVDEPTPIKKTVAKKSTPVIVDEPTLIKKTVAKKSTLTAPKTVINVDEEDEPTPSKKSIVKKASPIPIKKPVIESDSNEDSDNTPPSRLKITPVNAGDLSD